MGREKLLPCTTTLLTRAGFFFFLFFFFLPFFFYYVQFSDSAVQVTELILNVLWAYCTAPQACKDWGGGGRERSMQGMQLVWGGRTSWEARIANAGYLGNVNLVPPRAGLPGVLFWQLKSGRHDFRWDKIPRQSAGSQMALSSQKMFCNMRIYFSPSAFIWSTKALVFEACQG